MSALPSLVTSFTPITPPDDLTENNQWVPWRWDDEKKVPYTVHGRRADITNPNDLSSYEEVKAAWARNPEFYAGAGYAFTIDDDFVGVDIDNCLDEQGNPKAWAIPFIGKLADTYMEISPSGRGVKAFVKADLSRQLLIKIGDGQIEAYSRDRFFTVTGNVWRGAPLEIDHHQFFIDELVELSGSHKTERAEFKPESVKDAKAYVEAVIKSACSAIAAAQPGSQNNTLNREAYCAGRLVKYIDDLQPVKQVLLAAAKQMPNQPGKRPWRSATLQKLIDIGLRSGAMKPRVLIEQPPPRKPARLAIAHHAGDQVTNKVAEANNISSIEVNSERNSRAETKLSPNDIARMIIAERLMLSTEDGRLFEYRNNYWQLLSEATFRNRVLDIDPSTSVRKRNEALGFAKDRCLIQNKDLKWRNIQHFEIPFPNGVLNLDTSQLRDHRPEDYLDALVPHLYDPKAKWPTFEKALQLYFQGDPDILLKIAALQEFFGYFLMHHARYKKALVIYGPAGCGKTAIAEAITLVVGNDRVSQVSVGDMDDPRKLAPLVGKLVNINRDLSSDCVIGDGGFKTLISTQEEIQVDPKYQQPFSFTPIAKHILIGNTLPKIKDRSRGTTDRLLLIHFSHVITPAQRDTNYLEAFKKETLGILNFAVEGAIRLYRNKGQFTVLPESEKAKEEYRARENPLEEFFKDRLIEAPGAFIPRSAVTETYNHLYKEKWTENRMTKQLNALGKKVGPKYLDGSSVRCVLDYRWCEKSELSEAV